MFQSEEDAHMSETTAAAGPEELWLAAARERVAETRATLESLDEAIDDSFIAAVRLIRRASGKVVTVGVGTSGPVARRMAHLLATSGTPAVYLHPGDALHGALGAITAGDVILAMSKGGQSAEMNDFVTRARRRGAGIVALTANPASPLGQLADVTVRLPDVAGGDPGGVIAMGSSLLASAWGDALAIVLMRITGYGWDQVLDSHPSGAVGEIRQLPEALPRLPDVPRSERL
jgi:D-arabinose 5-phosphate isomerase GutQ